MVKADRSSHHHGLWARFNAWFARCFDKLLHRYDRLVAKALDRPKMVLISFGACFLLSLLLFPLMGLSFFPRTDAGQFVISFKAPSGTKLEATEEEAAKVEGIVRRVVSGHDMGMTVTNIGVDPGFSALFSPNAAMHTGFTQVALAEDHRTSSFTYIDEVKRTIAKELPELQTFYSSGSLVDGVLNMGAPAPIDVRVMGNDEGADYSLAQKIAGKIRDVRGVADVYIPQDLDYPSLRITIDRTRASELGLTEKETVSNIITALISNQMIAPSVWIDPNSGNNYFLDRDVQGRPDQIARRSESNSSSRPARCRFNALGHGRKYRAVQRADGDGPHPDPSYARYLCSPANRRPGPHREGDSEDR